MIRIVAKVLIKEGKTEEFLAAAKTLAAASQKEEGNHSYTVNVSTENPRQFAIIEFWESKQALGAHAKSAHFREAMGAIKETAESEMSIEMFVEV